MGKNYEMIYNISLQINALEYNENEIEYLELKLESYCLHFLV